MAPKLDPQWEAITNAIADKAASLVVSKLHESRPPVAPEWLSLKQAAAYLGYTTEKAFRDRCSKPNPPPSHKIGRLRRFHRAELDAWVRSDG